MDSIITTPTDNQRRDFTPIVEPGKKKSVLDEFNEKLAEEMQKANKKGLPFCDRAARDDFKDGYESQAKISAREHGFVKADDIKPVKLDWAKYSDLKNFDKLKEDEVFDEYQSKKLPGHDVTLKKVVYKFKGYSNIYTVMEDVPSAVRRAKDKLVEIPTSKKK
jgi:hypothetical protein